eukprot:3140420-Prymnesium_polylepis.1
MPRRDLVLLLGAPGILLLLLKLAVQQLLRSRERVDVLWPHAQPLHLEFAQLAVHHLVLVAHFGQLEAKRVHQRLEVRGARANEVVVAQVRDAALVPLLLRQLASACERLAEHLVGDTRLEVRATRLDEVVIAQVSNAKRVPLVRRERRPRCQLAPELLIGELAALSRPDGPHGVPVQTRGGELAALLGSDGPDVHPPQARGDAPARQHAALVVLGPLRLGLLGLLSLELLVLLAV